MLFFVASKISIREISLNTGMDPHDIAATLQMLNLFKLTPEKKIVIVKDTTLIETHMEKVNNSSN